MATWQRLFDRGTELGRAGLNRIGHELRDARRDRGLSLAACAQVAGISVAELSRIERSQSPMVPYLTLARCASVVGLDLSSRLFPGPRALRDAGHVALLADFRAGIHRSIRWATEVPLPIAGDLRAWDALVARDTWRYGVEAETGPRDAQGLNRRLQLKARDGEVDGVLLVLRDNRANRAFVRAAADELGPTFPQSSARALERMRAGVDPGGNAIVFLASRAARR
ncbi:MAG TPA: helix-turn-helix transcriptional regulator [Candidatus Dormibacteraeota bacterium]|nr:helix-turn-helix transcriptional regulator [Candidatus Dormibacteraeota bacterium]